jgi:hypothetical protein
MRFTRAGQPLGAQGIGGALKAFFAHSAKNGAKRNPEKPGFSRRFAPRKMRPNSKKTSAAIVSGC